MITKELPFRQRKSAPPSLQSLPPELLIHVYAHLHTAQSLARLSQTCKQLHAFTQKEGWRVFLRASFPSLPVPPELHDYSSAAHSLTSLSRNWDRRAFIAKYVQPAEVVIDGATGRRVTWERPSGQTMGYQPCIDSYEVCSQGGKWAGRREVLAWSAGSKLVLRVKEKGPHLKGSYERYERARKGAQNRHRGAARHGQVVRPEEEFDEYGHKVDWYTWKRPGSLEGRDDITTLKIVKTRGQEAVDEDRILVGTPQGHLEMLRATTKEGRIRQEATFETSGRHVRSSDISDRLVVAGLGDTTIAIYPLNSTARTVIALQELDILPDKTRDCRIWSTSFLSSTKLAVGLGVSNEPLNVYTVTPTGIHADPLRKFRFPSYMTWPSDAPSPDTPYKSTSIYPIIPLPATSAAGHADGDVFLSGCFDGIIRVHDLRAPEQHVSTYTDPHDDSSIYSLATLGRERLVAGCARYSMLKVFDLRVAGGRAYSYCSAAAPSHTDPPQDVHRQEDPAGPSAAWNVFLNPRNTALVPPASHAHRHRRTLDSPVYALAAPSPTSASLYAGVENNILGVDFISMLDAHPDATFENCVRRVKGRVDARRTWNPRGNVLNLGMYEQGGEGAVRLRVQRGVGWYEGGVKGVDERWVEGSGV